MENVWTLIEGLHLDAASSLEICPGSGLLGGAATARFLRRRTGLAVCFSIPSLGGWPSAGRLTLEVHFYFRIETNPHLFKFASGNSHDCLANRQFDTKSAVTTRDAPLYASAAFARLLEAGTDRNRDPRHRIATLALDYLHQQGSEEKVLRRLALKFSAHSFLRSGKGSRTI